MESTEMLQQIRIMNGRLEGIDRSLAELIRLLRALNGRLREQEEDD